MGQKTLRVNSIDNPGAFDLIFDQAKSGQIAIVNECLFASDLHFPLIDLGQAVHIPDPDILPITVAHLMYHDS